MYFKVCKRLSLKIVSYAAKHAASKCTCEQGREDDPWAVWKDNNLFELTCKSASLQSIASYTKKTLQEDFFVATDHETSEADSVFTGLQGQMIAGMDDK
jgi:hypothetical protein